jgi:hypothetical protein
MKAIQIICCLISLLVETTYVRGQDNDSLLINLSMSKAQPAQPEDLKISVEIVSKKLGILEVPVDGI